MQTFLPFEDFARSASVLDRRRLGKQRSENLQIMMAILGYVKSEEDQCFYPGEQPAWIVKHWVTDMWRGHEAWLLKYHAAVIRQWVEGYGYKDTTGPKMLALIEREDLGTNRPPWLGTDDVHVSHQSVLIQKDYDFYRGLFPLAPDNRDYVHVRGRGALYFG